MKYKNVINLLGAVAFIVGVGSNMHYALSDYGIVNNSLHIEVLAQSSSSSGGGGTTGGDFNYSKEEKVCLYKGTAEPFSVVKLGPGAITNTNHEGKWEFELRNGEVHCYGGGSEACVPKNCPAYPGRTT